MKTLRIVGTTVFVLLCVLAIAIYVERQEVLRPKTNTVNAIPMDLPPPPPVSDTVLKRDR